MLFTVNFFGLLLTRQADLVFENLVLRQQLNVYARKQPQPKVADRDRMLLMILTKLWSEDKQIVLPSSQNAEPAHVADKSLYANFGPARGSYEVVSPSNSRAATFGYLPPIFTRWNALLGRCYRKDRQPEYLSNSYV